MWLGRVSDRELINYYKYALCFVYPSLYEGFGIPPLEAMVSQCPVIASDINVFHEIYNKAVLYVNPTDEEQISDVIRLLINDEKLQRKLVDLGENSHNYIHGKKVH